MKQPFLLLLAILVVAAQTQTTSQDLISALISEAYSIFSSVTSDLGDTSTDVSTASTMSSESIDASATDSLTALVTSAVTRTRPSRTTNPTASASISSVSVLTAASNTSSATTLQTTTGDSDTSGSDTAAAATATSISPSSSSNHDRMLAIVLGTVLGALALGLFILLLLILCRRRRRRTVAARNASLSSTSDEALAAHKTPSSRVTPLAGAFASKRSQSRSLDRRSNYGPPSMSERSQYEVPSPYEFRDPTLPFVPGAADTRRSSRTLATQNGDNFVSTGPLQDGNGLNNHPYHHDRHTGRMAAAGTGGAALGAAAARRLSRSSERRREHRLSRDRELHPTHLDGPLPQSPHRYSGESTRRRSDSMPRSSFLGPQDLARRAQQNNASLAAPDGLTGTESAANSAVVRSVGLQTHERGRSLPSDPPPYNTGVNGMGTGQPTAHNNIGSLNPNGTASAIGAVSPESRTSDFEHVHTRSQTYPPIPSALMIQNPNTRRSMPSRSPKRTRFSDTDMYHEPMPVTNRTSGDNPMDEPISPISTTGPLKRGSNEVPTAFTGADFVASPRSRSVSPERPTRLASDPSTPGPIPSAISGGIPYSIATTNAHPTQRSGLVSAVQDHFSRTSEPTNTSPSQLQPPVYQAYNPYVASENEAIHPAADTLAPSNTMARQISRKPVAYSPYNTTKLPPVLSPPTGNPSPSSNLITGVRRSIGNGSDRENWWRGQEEEAWTHSYTNDFPNATHAMNNGGVHMAR